MADDNRRLKENKLIKALIPKISDYYVSNEFVKKEELSKFLDFIDLSTLSEKESLWKELSKDCKDPDKKGLPKVLLVKNLTEFIHNHNEELFQPEATLADSVFNFLNNPKDLNAQIDTENDAMFEFYKLLASIEFSTSKMIPIFTLEENLKNYKFINLDKDSLCELMEELLKEKCTSIKKEQYLNIVEQMEKQFRYLIEEKAKKKRVFTDEELDHPELSTFDHLLSFDRLLFKLNDSLLLCHEKNIEAVKANEQLKAQYYSKFYKVLMDNMRLYFYEIMRVYYEQKQKFDYFDCSIVSKFTILKQQINDVNEDARKQRIIDENKNKEALQVLNQEILNEKNNNEKTLNEMKKLKNENLKLGDDIILANNKILDLQKIIEEKEANINSLKKENELVTNNYTDVLAKLNGQLFQIKEKEKRKSQLIQNMNLNDSQKELVNKSPEELLFYIVEKEKYFNTLENKNKELMEKIEELENDRQKIIDEFSDLKSKGASLEKKLESITNENEDLLRQLNDYKGQKSNMLSALLEEKPEEDENIINSSRTNPSNYISTKSSNLEIKAIQKKVKEEKNEKCYDYLCIRMDERYVQNLDDEYYNGNSNLIFSEYINYLDENKNTIDCVLFITNNNLYLFNNVTYKKCFSIPIDDLSSILVSTNNNYVSFIFETGEVVIFEIFRILELMNFFKSLNALHKTRNPITINIDEINNQFVKNKSKNNNYTTSPYFSKAIFSGRLKQKVEGIFNSGFENRFVILTEIGLIIMDKPNGKPLEIINPLFSKNSIYNGGEGEFCFMLFIGKSQYTFSAESLHIRTKWLSLIEYWIKKTNDEEKLSV